MFNVLQLTILVGVAISPNALIANASGEEELLELSCFVAADCKQYQHSGLNATCVDKTCQCFNKEKQQLQCQPKASYINNIVGGLCPCLFANSECNNEQGICYCQQNYMPSLDKRRCLPKSAKLNANCELNSQCEATNNLAVCRSFGSTCHCRDGFIQSSNDVCLSTFGESFNCTKDMDCQALHLDHAVCLTSKQQCVCKEGFIKSEFKPVCISAINQFHSPCNENMQCIYSMGSAALCSNSSCKCDEKHVMVYENRNGTFEVVCERIVEFGQYCRSDIDCFERNKPESAQSMGCFFAECNCKSGFYSLNNGPCTRSNGAFKWRENKYLPIILAAFLTFSNFCFVVGFFVNLSYKRV